MTEQSLRAALDAAPWKRFVAIGDSITEGYGMDAVEGVDSIPWAQRVADELRKAQPDLEFLNLGRRNLKADAIREQQLRPALDFDPDFVTVTAGPNDLLDPEMAREPLERELDGILGPLAETGATVLTFTYMNMPGSGLYPEDGAKWLADRMETLHEATRAAAERHGALLLDLYSEPESANPDFFSADLQHANAAGQQFVAARTLDFLAEHLATTAPRS
jgi:lysophospholipase L1-like esterase